MHVFVHWEPHAISLVHSFCFTYRLVQEMQRFYLRLLYLSTCTVCELPTVCLWGFSHCLPVWYYLGLSNTLKG